MLRLNFCLITAIVLVIWLVEMACGTAAFIQIDNKGYGWSWNEIAQWGVLSSVVYFLLHLWLRFHDFVTYYEEERERNEKE